MRLVVIIALGVLTVHCFSLELLIMDLKETVSNKVKDCPTDPLISIFYDKR